MTINESIETETVDIETVDIETVDTERPTTASTPEALPSAHHIKIKAGIRAGGGPW